MDFVADVSIVVLVFATLAQAWSWLGSYAGIVSFGNAVFFGIGGYAVAVSNLRGGSPWYGALGGALFAVMVAAVCGLLFLRGRGYVFSCATFVLGALAEPFVAFQAWVGPHNAYNFPLKPGFFNLQFGQKWPYLLLALGVFAVAQALTLGMRRSALGFRLRALRTNPIAARSIGVSARPLRMLTLVASAFVTSVAGSFFAEYALGVTPHAMFGLSLSLDIALVGVIAGPQSAWGAPLAGLVYACVVKVVALHPAGAAGAAVLAAEGVVIMLIALLRPHGVFASVLHRSLAPRAQSAA